MKSNITIASNVYNRINEDIAQDPNYVAAVNEVEALKKIASQIEEPLSTVKLSHWQEQIIREDMPCSFNRKAGRKDATHGLIKTDQGFVWSCRCEYIACENYESCMAEAYSLRINREIKPVDIPVAENIPEASFRYVHLGDTANIFEPSASTDTYLETDDTGLSTQSELAAILNSALTAALNPALNPASNPALTSELTSIALTDPAKELVEYTKIELPDTIITAPVKSHILVNAGSGTGKTYTVIRRLEHLAKTQAVEDFGNVLALCYTNAAKNEIKKRLEEGIAAGELPPEARQFDIRTFDSLATAYLSDIDDNAFALLDYDGRIARFNEKLDPERFSLFEYIIIDELQDLVNERAKMAVNILKSLNGGWLLCGDKCQAIYDYDCDGDGKVSSVDFYKQLEHIFPPDIERYEIVGNKRQEPILSERSKSLRKALLELEPKAVNKLFKNEIKAYPSAKFSIEPFAESEAGSTTAIICRKSSEAEWISAKLREAEIPHNLLRSVVQCPSLNRWIADMFWDFRERQCGRAEFVERYRVRIFDNEAVANEAFSAIVNAVEIVFDKDASAELINMDNLRKALKAGVELNDRLLNIPAEHLTVSTIYNAKGREFDNVYLLSTFNPVSDTTEEARIWYVGATRPKRDMKTLKSLYKSFGERTSMGRHVIKNKKRGQFGGKAYHYASHIVIGFPEDLDSEAFVDGDFRQALSTQSYIAENVKVNDRVELILSNGAYGVFHDECLIGRLSVKATKDFWMAMEASDNQTNIPPYISDVFVSNIVTITPIQYPSGVPQMFKESGFWLGVELTGFGRIDWHYGGSNQL